MKRVIDILVSLLGIILLFPFLTPVMIILKFTGEHYIFYRQQRVGKNGKVFQMIKFSTMLYISPYIGSGEITLRNDPRVFPFGSFLRKTKINELPQLWNVLWGDMSLVGPRPLPPKNFSFYTSDQQEMIKRIKPGMTGVGSIIFRGEDTMLAQSALDHEGTHRILMSPHKAELEEWYLQNQSLWEDLKIILLTFWVILFNNSPLPYKWLKGLPELPKELRSLNNLKMDGYRVTRLNKIE
jgi:lipopolysaccharide/colanic/teichoic acid biosynthesis glycosyltransferase